jgi:2-polyprenyl-3-methyl-5-hydroxy-6-metoxy-1,4-benzoquinol methylase
MINSPLTGSDAVTPVMEFSTAFISDGYKNELGIDVSEYFVGQKEIKLYKCNKTGYRFFHPAHLAGNESLYKHLEQYDWYYSRWKWENDFAMKQMQKNDRVLDIGCGDGFFLDGLRKNGIQCEGIETNHSAALKAGAKGHVIHEMLIQNFSADHNSVYDIVCAMQVLEHIYDVADFVSHAMKIVKPGGKLIIAVPNNNPFLYRYDACTLLNLPPHHMGWWNEESLYNAAEYFKADSCTVTAEPLQDNERYTYFMKYAEVKIPSAFRKLFTKFRSRYSRIINEQREGRNLVAIYTKSKNAA